MRIAKQLSISTVAFLISLGSVPALAQTAANDDTLQSAAVDRMVDRDFNQENGSDGGVQVTDKDRNTGITSDAGTNTPVDLTPDGQTLQTDETKLKQAQTTEHEDFQQLRTDERAGNADAAKDDRAHLIAQQQVVQTDRQTVMNDATVWRQALQPQIQAVQEDRMALRTDLQQTRADQQDGNTVAVQQDMTNDQTARQNLQTADTALQQDRIDNGLPAPHSVRVAGDNQHRSDDEAWRNRSRLARNGTEASMAGDNVSSRQVVANENIPVNGNASGQPTTSTTIGATGGTNAWNGQTINTPPAITGGSSTGVVTTGSTTTRASANVPAAASVTRGAASMAPHIIPHHR